VWKGGDFSAASIWTAALGSGERRLLIEGATAPRYVAPDVLVFARGGGLFAVRFDARRRAISGDAIPVVSRVWSDRTSGTAHYAASATGTLVFAEGGEILERRRLAWVDRRGQKHPLPAEPSYYANPRLSPDGLRIAVEALNDLWIYNTVDTTLNRVTFHGVNQHPVWSPDGRRLAFSSSRGVATPTVFWAEIDAGEFPEPIGRGGGVQFPASWTQSGNALAYARLDRAAPGTGWDLWVFHPGEATPERQIVHTPFKDDQPILSPDGSALAYVSNETGKLEVYARAFPSLDRRVRISVDGGTEPVWSRTGREVFFRRGRQYFAVALGRAGNVLSAGRPVLMFEGDYLVGSLTPGFPSYDVTPDGQRFVVVEPSADSPRIERIEVVIDWQHELARRLTPGAKR
jgi:hypothetical protein